ncbi:MAG TPA: hypothetical protein VJ576_03430 [Rhodocyclaceae bacterium]|nr:hypothetical protein [Rhodocyclaceae bacterium]
MEKLDFIEAAARANAAFHVASAEMLAKEANSTLLLLLSGAGGALAYAVNLFDKGGLPWAIAGMAAASVYLFALSAWLVWCALRIRPIWPTANEPATLLSADWTIEELREAELRSQQRCIERNRLRNDEIGAALNRVRIGASCVPLVFIVAAASWSSR